jgi:eukaryotic-like serine/threonine-protein kinase
VYSLGVLLYELLIGAVPFDTSTLRNAGLAEMLRMIREDEAPSLSRKLTSMEAAATEVAARRQTDPVSLGRLVDGDLNSITMKALEKARERRYASVSDLAADIQRHMEDRPCWHRRRAEFTEAGSFSAGCPRHSPLESYSSY